MTKKVTPDRTMDIHLLSRVEDDGSPFGVEYSTRRLTLDPSGTVTCDDPTDALWQELAAGIPEVGNMQGEALTPREGTLFLDRVPNFFRYHYLGPCLPLVYDRRGGVRPDDFRIVWNPRANLDVGHGYGFGYRTELAKTRRARALEPLVATLNGWGFMHEFDRPAEEPTEDRVGKPRIVVVDLLQRDSPEWSKAGLNPDVVLAATKAFIRTFLRRFFERRTMGVFPEHQGESDRFIWRGGF